MTASTSSRRQIETAKRDKAQPNVPASKVAELDAAIARNQAELERARSEYDSLTKRADDLKAQAAAGRSRRRRSKAQTLEREAASAVVDSRSRSR